MSNLARFVVIIWCFVVLILTQSYTASLTSLLTVQQLQPTITDVSQLLKNRENVGFQMGSFVEGILKQMGFQDHQFKIYGTPEELHRLFANGSKNGGIAAAFDETPYTKLFLAKYCSKFIMVEPTFKADGFAFVRPLSLYCSFIFLPFLSLTNLYLTIIYMSIPGFSQGLSSRSRHFKGNTTSD